MFGDSLLADKFPITPVAGIDLKPGEGKEFSKEDGHIVDKPVEEEAVK